jgi:hypothetical protein
MSRKTATIERYHVYGTPNYCVALFYQGRELTPKESPRSVLHRWIPGDSEGVTELTALAARLGFTHVRYVGNWERQTKPRDGELSDS